jgi:hypothetical protein
MAAHPKLVTFAIGLAITTSIAIAIGTATTKSNIAKAAHSF